MSRPTSGRGADIRQHSNEGVDDEKYSIEYTLALGELNGGLAPTEQFCVDTQVATIRMATIRSMTRSCLAIPRAVCFDTRVVELWGELVVD